eukprot:7048643-Pyramimonas_sp.AAC.1
MSPASSGGGSATRKSGPRQEWPLLRGTVAKPKRARRIRSHRAQRSGDLSGPAQKVIPAKGYSKV